MEKQREQATVNEIIEVISDIILQCINNKNDKDVKENVRNSTKNNS